MSLLRLKVKERLHFLSLKSKIFTETPQMIGQRYMKGDCFFFTRFFDHLARQKQVFFGPLRALGLSATKLKQQIF